MSRKKPTRWCWRPPVTRHVNRPVVAHLRVLGPFAVQVAVAAICTTAWAVSHA